MHKNDVLAVALTGLFAMGRLYCTDNAFNVCTAEGRFAGKRSTTALPVVDVGFGYGRQKAIRSGKSPSYLAIARLQLPASRTTGWGKCLKKTLLTSEFGILFTMRPIFIKMVAY